MGGANLHGFKAPTGSGGGQRAKRAGGGVGIGIWRTGIGMVFKPPPGAGGGVGNGMKNSRAGQICPAREPITYRD